MALPALALAAAALAAGTFTRTGDAKVTFQGKGTGGFKLVGTTEQLTLRDDGETLTFTVPLNTVKTGIELRDRHMREKYLETAKHPDATLVVARSAVKIPAKDGEKLSGEATGKLTVHGVTRDQRFTYSAHRAGKLHHVTGAFAMNFRDHGVIVPSYLGVTVKPDVEVQVRFSLQE